jgi:predicted ribosomally synthesized peptide with SipW-like signal peptide
VSNLKKTLLSLGLILLVIGVMGGATWAIFSSQAKVENNTFATGTLEIRVNGQPATAGFNFTNAAPGSSVEKQFTLMNYGAPHFAGPSTLPAKELDTASAKTAGDDSLYNALQAKLYANAGWGGCSNAGVAFVAGKGCTVYSGPLSGLDGDILHATQWGAHPDLIPGNSFTMTLVVELPVDAGNELMGKSTTFDLVIDAYNPHRP